MNWNEAGNLCYDAAFKTMTMKAATRESLSHSGSGQVIETGSRSHAFALERNPAGPRRTVNDASNVRLNEPINLDTSEQLFDTDQVFGCSETTVERITWYALIPARKCFVSPNRPHDCQQRLAGDQIVPTRPLRFPDLVLPGPWSLECAGKTRQMSASAARRRSRTATITPLIIRGWGDTRNMC